MFQRKEEWGRLGVRVPLKEMLGLCLLQRKAWEHLLQVTPTALCKRSLEFRPTASHGSGLIPSSFLTHSKRVDGADAEVCWGD